MRRFVLAGALVAGVLAVGVAPAGAAPAKVYRSDSAGGWLADVTGTSVVFKGTVVVPAWNCAKSAAQSGVGFLLFVGYDLHSKFVQDAVGVSTDCRNGTAVTEVDTDLGGPGSFPEGKGHDNEIKAGDKLELSIGVKAGHSTIRLDDVTHPAVITATAPGGKPVDVAATASSIFSGSTQLPVPQFAPTTFTGLLADKKSMGHLTTFPYDLVRAGKVEVTPGPLHGGTSYTLTDHL